ncbi:hypothetical protein EXU48_15480 [Occultella glacieicola]|uniref:Uncharacterized protein n=1 Tax=Occultella glacieicola TaxID=2518684 RepID=A0ABY2E209_9MICO|nr:hypothetical protein [Occultella glacieicola]TDE91546.1 hypothetical protein EXU48_15480 [Occultella glacieicola]
MNALEPDEPAAGKVLDARLHLLDRQVLDPDDVPVATLADLDLEVAEDGTVTIGAMLFGGVFLARLAGGRPPRSLMHKVPWRDVVEVDQTIHLSVGADGLDATWVERWVRDHVIGRIPGAGHAPE